MSFDGQKLFDLLPALYRLRDAQIAQSQDPPGGPLQSLLMLVAEQLAAVEADLDQLYDDQFIETCAPWVIPYIGDLIGYRSVKGIAPAVASPRAEVAHTISFRRRKGTALVLEQLARDVTGWGAHAVEFFQRLADTQFMNHIRLHNHYAPDLRRWEPREYMGGGFDTTAHTVDVRRIASERGRYNIQNIGIFLWSLNAYSLTMSRATAVGDAPHCFRFSPLGRDMQLFNHPISQGADIAQPAAPTNVPDRLRRRVLCRDRNAAAAVYYGAGKSLALYIDGALKSNIQVCELSGDDGHWDNLPQPGSRYDAAIDPELGRIALPPDIAASAKVQASFYYGFNADMGGGEYPRAASFASKTEPAVVRVPGDYATIGLALAAIPGDGVVEITDSNLYQEPGLTINVSPHRHIQLRAHDGRRPVLVLGGEIAVTGGEASEFDLNGLLVTSAIAPAHPAPAALIHVPSNGPDGKPNQLSKLGLTHTTLVPGWALSPHGDPQHDNAPVVIAEPTGLLLTIAKSIIGAIRLPELATATITDSILDATKPSGVAYAALDGAGGGGALTLEGCTVVGKVHATLLSLVSESIVWSESVVGEAWAGPLWADRKQQGCVRFSYIPAGSVIPRQYECVLEGYGTDFPGWIAATSIKIGQVIAATALGVGYVFRCITSGVTGAAEPSFPASHGSIVTDGAVTWQNVGTPAITPGPLFESLRYGDSGYAKLLAETDDRIRRGAEDGGEMGAFHFVLAPLRETDLRVRLQEYLPVGLEFGIFYET